MIFRGDGFIDAGGRFADIDSKVEVSAKNYIKTVTDAIKKSIKSHDATDEYIEIHLDALTDYFTDNEATIFITLQKDKILYYYIPVVNSCELLDIKKQTYNTSNYQWFIRTSPTGELRLSCYKLITA